MSKILVLDERPIVREPLAAALNGMGYEAACAGDLNEAVYAGVLDDSDLILLGLFAPTPCGMATLQRIRAHGPTRTTPVIMVTEAVSKEFVLKAAKLGVSGWMFRSRFLFDDLIERIRRALSSTGASSEAAPTPGAARGASAAAPAVTAGPVPQVTGAADADGPHAERILHELKPIIRRSEVQDHLNHCGELKGLSPIVTRILKLCRSSNCSIDDVARAIKQDHAISLKVLRLANSTVYTRGDAVDSVPKAVVRIGLSQIQQTVMNIGVIERFGLVGIGETISPLQFWEHSIATGLIAAEATREIGGTGDEIDAAFTMGLIHDVGRMVYLEMFGDRYIQVLEKARELKLPLEQVESRLMLINHADAMDRLLHGWRFPKELINPIAFHHLSVDNIRRIVPRDLQQVATVALANRLAHALLLGSSGNTAVYAIDGYLRTLNIGRSFIRRVERDVPDQTADIKFVMLASCAGDSWPEMRSMVRANMNEPFRPIFAGKEPDLDPMRIFCQRIAAPPEPDRKPNVAVVRIKNRTECAAVTAMLEAVEADAGVHNLPAVILSPNAAIDLGKKQMARRRTRLLPFPVAVDHVIEAFNRLYPAKPDQLAA